MYQNILQWWEQFLFRAFVEHTLGGMAACSVARGTLYMKMICCVPFCVLSYHTAFYLQQEEVKHGKDLDWFCPLTYWEHFHSNISELFDLEILYKLHDASPQSFQRSLRICFPNVQHPDMIPYSRCKTLLSVAHFTIRILNLTLPSIFHAAVFLLS